MLGQYEKSNITELPTPGCAVWDWNVCLYAQIYGQFVGKYDVRGAYGEIKPSYNSHCIFFSGEFVQHA